MTTAVDELKTVLTRHQRDWAAPWASDGHGTLVGRGADLDRIGAFIAGVPRAGGPLLLMGEPGAGKTALLAAGGRQAKASGICVLATAGVEYKARLSYAGVQQLLDATAGSQPAIRLSGPPAVVLGRADGLAPGPGAVTEATLSLLRQMARSKPTLAVDEPRRRSRFRRVLRRRRLVHPRFPGHQQHRAGPGPRLGEHAIDHGAFFGPAQHRSARFGGPANSQDERSTFVQPRRIGPRHRRWALTMWSPRPAGGRPGDREISPRHRTGTIPVRKHQYTRPAIGETT
jgi:AAA ATPase-like protein